MQLLIVLLFFCR